VHGILLLYDATDPASLSALHSWHTVCTSPNLTTKSASASIAIAPIDVSVVGVYDDAATPTPASPTASAAAVKRQVLSGKEFAAKIHATTRAWDGVEPKPRHGSTHSVNSSSSTSSRAAVVLCFEELVYRVCARLHPTWFERSAWKDVPSAAAFTAASASAGSGGVWTYLDGPFMSPATSAAALSAAAANKAQPRTQAPSNAPPAAAPAPASAAAAAGSRANSTESAVSPRSVPTSSRTASAAAASPSAAATTAAVPPPITHAPSVAVRTPQEPAVLAFPTATQTRVRVQPDTHSHFAVALLGAAGGKTLFANQIKQCYGERVGTNDAGVRLALHAQLLSCVKVISRFVLRVSGAGAGDSKRNLEPPPKPYALLSSSSLSFFCRCLLYSCAVSVCVQ
jgi:hypothetical protein